MALWCHAFRCRGEQAERAMHAGVIVARVIKPCLIELHVKRPSALLRAVSALLVGGVTSLSAIALCLEGSQRLKHRIKSVDRLLSNDALHGARSNIYALLARRWLAGLSQVLLVIDWSDMTADQRWQWLRASVVVEARSVTLYEEVHPQKRLGNPQVHRRFLRRVAAMLPRGCTPIVMTDAGFRSSWFQLVRAQGWLFVGRGTRFVRTCHHGSPRLGAGAVCSQQPCDRPSSFD